jgi:hypothetical protein
MNNKPYKILFSKVPSPNPDDFSEWTKFEVLDAETGKLISGSSRQGSEADITKYVDEMMYNRSNSIQLVGSGNRRKNKGPKGINLPKRKRVKI